MFWHSDVSCDVVTFIVLARTTPLPLCVHRNGGGGRNLVTVIDQQGVHRLTLHQPAEVSTWAPVDSQHVIAADYVAASVLMVADADPDENHLCVLGGDDKAMTVVKVTTGETAPERRRAVRLKDLRGIACLCDTCILIADGARVHTGTLMLARHGGSSAKKVSIRSATLALNLCHEFSSKICALASHNTVSKQGAWCVCEDLSMWQLQEGDVPVWNRVGSAKHPVKALAVTDDGGLAYCDPVTGTVSMHVGDTIASIGGDNGHSWQSGLQHTCVLGGVCALGAVGNGVWAGGGGSVAVLSRCGGLARVATMMQRIAAPFGLNKGAKGMVVGGALRHLQAALEDLNRWAGQARGRSGTATQAAGPQMAHSREVREALTLLTNSLKEALKRGTLTS